MRILCVIAAAYFFCISPPQQTNLPDDSILSALATPHPVDILASQSLDLDSDGAVETVVITSERSVAGHPIGGEIVVLRETDGVLSPIWRRGNLNPWKLETGDVDGDGTIDIAVGVWKRSPFDPVMARRVFVYYWDGESLQPKWLGSRLVRRFDDFVLCDANSDGWAELFALETAEAGKHRVSAYRWRIFGFEWLGCSDDLPGLNGLTVEDGLPFALTMSDQFKINLLNDRVELSLENT